jgi:hypothetical protein
MILIQFHALPVLITYFLRFVLTLFYHSLLDLQMAIFQKVSCLDLIYLPRKFHGLVTTNICMILVQTLVGAGYANFLTPHSPSRLIQGIVL